MSQPKGVSFGSLLDRYLLTEGRVPLSGIQGIVRSMIDSSRADHSDGNDIAVFVSGYQGSPLGGLDTELLRSKSATGPNHLVFQPGLNEELAATSVVGTQLLDNFKGCNVKGVTGVWYGKSPGVDRATDALRHGNLIGASPNGGAVILAGDDPAAKSSTVPGSSDATLAALGMPVFFPGNTADMLVLFRHAVMMSRVSGLWAGFKVVTKVADSTGVFQVSPPVEAVIPSLEWMNRPYRHRPDAHLLGPRLLEMEQTLTGIRLDLAREYLYLNNLNPTFGKREATLGIVASGTSYFDLLTALGDLGLQDSPAIRLMKLTVLHPLDSRAISNFAKGLKEILVVEEKGSFVEKSIKEILYGVTGAPIVTGKLDIDGSNLVPAFGALEADDITRIVGRRVMSHFEFPGVQKRLEELNSIDQRTVTTIEQRTPFFCSGCPHNTSTHASDNSIVGAGIGCHTLVLLNPAGRGDLAGVTQMGGEGAQFIGMAPFLPDRHFFQNMGDGTFHHSGSLAIRAAVASGINITYKILYNDAVAMTGGQKVEGQLSIPEMIETLYLEGVVRVVVTTDDLSRYRSVDLPHQSRVYGREHLDQVQKELSQVAGVSVIIHDQLCAIEKRRRRRSGKLVSPTNIVVINERTCEGCGDCGEKSNCLSVEPVMTEFGRKTRINQGSCSHDLSCLQGDCPSFMLVDKDLSKPRTRIALPSVEIAQPVLGTEPIDVKMRLIGIGGTGVVTLAAILEVAALIDGKFTMGLDQTGLSQKAGPVISDIRITSQPVEGAVTLSAGSADLLLGFDLTGTAGAKNLRVSNPDGTRAVVSTSVVPTGRQVTDVTHIGSAAAAALELIARYTKAQENFYLPAQELANVLYDDEIPANVIVLGAAWQLGLVPIGLPAIKTAFQLNGIGLATNLEAFEWGRIAVVHPDKIHTILNPTTPLPEISSKITAQIEALGLEAVVDRNSIALLAQDLIAYQDNSLANSYIVRVAEVAQLMRDKFGPCDDEIVLYAKGLYKFLAYKDEFEVARLHLEWLAQAPKGTRASVLLHPPILRSMGLNRKIEFRKTARPTMAVLYHLRFLRNSWTNPFGHSSLRKLERKLAPEYDSAVKTAISKADPSRLQMVGEICSLPDMVRGYEGIKQSNVVKYRDRLAELSSIVQRGAALTN